MTGQEKAELLEEMRKNLVTHLLDVCIQYARANLRTPDGMLGVVFVKNALESAPGPGGGTQPTQLPGKPMRETPVPRGKPQ